LEGWHRFDRIGRAVLHNLHTHTHARTHTHNLHTHTLKYLNTRRASGSWKCCGRKLRVVGALPALRAAVASEVMSTLFVRLRVGLLHC